MMGRRRVNPPRPAEVRFTCESCQAVWLVPCEQVDVTILDDGSWAWWTCPDCTSIDPTKGVQQMAVSVRQIAELGVGGARILRWCDYASEAVPPPATIAEFGHMLALAHSPVGTLREIMGHVAQQILDKAEAGE